MITLNEMTEINFTTFDPRAYLEEYYTTIDFENDQLLRFFSTCYQHITPQATLLEFGSGPTLYSLITAAAKVDRIYACDMLPANLEQIRLWQNGSEQAFDWEPFIRRALQIEGKTTVTYEEVQCRTELLRHKLTLLGYCDAFRNPPLLTDYNEGYDIVQVNFVPESITSSLNQWELALQNILTLLKPQGTFLITALKHAKYYQVYHHNYPAVSVDETMLVETLMRWGFEKTHIAVKTIPANAPFRGYSGMIFVKSSLSM